MSQILEGRSKTIDHYLKQIRNNKPLTTEEEHELGRRIMSGDIDARNKLIETNLRLVLTCAIKMATPKIPIDEVIAAGNYGLVIAATRYNPSFKGRFGSYAIHYIREHIRQAIREYFNQVHIPIEVLKAAHKPTLSVNDELDYYQLIDKEYGTKTPSVYPTTYESFDKDFGAEDEEATCRPLIERVAAPMDSAALEYALRDAYTDFREFLGHYYDPIDVNVLMDYANKCLEGYTIADLAHDYRVPTKKMNSVIADIMQKTHLYHLLTAYQNAA